MRLCRINIRYTSNVYKNNSKQTAVERKKWDEIDWTRNGIFVLFGFTYLGGFQYWLMINKYRQWFPTMDRFGKLPLKDKIKDTAGMLDAIKMVCFDVLFHVPCIYFPSFYTCKEIVSGSTYNPVDCLKNGISKYRKNMKEDLTAMIMCHLALQHVYNFRCRLICACHSVTCSLFSGQPI